MKIKANFIFNYGSSKVLLYI